MSLQDMSIVQVKALSQSELVDLILKDRVYSLVTRQEGDSRGMLAYESEDYDYTGMLLASHAAYTSYFDDGSVDTITRIDVDYRDGKVRVCSRDIKHDGLKSWAENSTDETIEAKEPLKAITILAKLPFYSRIKKALEVLFA